MVSYRLLRLLRHPGLSLGVGTALSLMVGLFVYQINLLSGQNAVLLTGLVLLIAISSELLLSLSVVRRETDALEMRLWEQGQLSGSLLDIQRHMDYMRQGDSPFGEATAAHFEHSLAELRNAVRRAETLRELTIEDKDYIRYIDLALGEPMIRHYKVISELQTTRSFATDTRGAGWLRFVMREKALRSGAVSLVRVIIILDDPDTSQKPLLPDVVQFYIAHPSYEVRLMQPTILERFVRHSQITENYGFTIYGSTSVFLYSPSARDGMLGTWVGRQDVIDAHQRLFDDLWDVAAEEREPRGNRKVTLEDLLNSSP